MASVPSGQVTERVVKLWELFESKNDAEQHMDDISRAMTSTYVIPKLKNQDFYRQYRFSVALAAVKGKEARAQAGEPPFAAETPWGENEIVVSFDPHIADWLDDALQMVGLTPADKKLISTPKSEESSTVSPVSPVKPFRGYPR